VLTAASPKPERSVNVQYARKGRLPTDSIESQGKASIEMWYEANEMRSTVICGGAAVGVAGAGGGLGRLMKVPRLRAVVQMLR
jgi:hypothetical protein